MPSCEVLILPIVRVLNEDHGLWVVGEGEDVFRQLHSVVAGVDGAADSACGCVNWQAIPPLYALGGPIVVCESLIFFIRYEYTL